MMNSKDVYYKLYEVACDVPHPFRILVNEDDFSWLDFHRLDGAYSFCSTPDGKPCHLGASSPLVKIGLFEDDILYYRLVQNENELEKAAAYFKRLEGVKRE